MIDDISLTPARYTDQHETKTENTNTTRSIALGVHTGRGQTSSGQLSTAREIEKSTEQLSRHIQRLCGLHYWNFIQDLWYLLWQNLLWQFGCDRICCGRVAVEKSAVALWLWRNLLWMCGYGENCCGSVVVVGFAVAVWL